MASIGLITHDPIQLPTHGRPLRTSSVGLGTYTAARAIGHRVDTVAYHLGGRTRGRRRLERFLDVDFVGIPIGADVRLRRAEEAIRRIRPSARPAFASPWYLPQYGSRVGIDARSRSLDVLEINNYGQLAPLLARLAPRAHLVLRMHCDWLVQLERSLVESWLQRCALVSAVSEHVANGVRSRFPAFADSVTVQPNLFDLDAFPTQPMPDAEAPLVLYVGRISPEKGLHVLVEAFAAMAQKHPTVRLAMIGSPSPADRSMIVDVEPDPVVRALARFYGPTPYPDQLLALVPSACRDRVEIRPPVPPDGIAAAYAESTVVVLPSVGPESFGRPLVEALAVGRPVVGTDAGGIPEVIDDGQDGHVVPSNDPNMLAEALLAVIENPARAETMGLAGGRRVRRDFDLDLLGCRLATTYLDLVR